jgi:membrane protease YdiL (CAAX protease family)
MPLGYANSIFQRILGEALSNVEVKKRRAAQVVVAWLFFCFCVGIFVRFQHTADADSSPDIIQVAERLAVVGRYSSELSPDLSQQLLDMAEEIEEDSQAKMVIRGEVPTDATQLTGVYALMAGDTAGTSANRERLTKLADVGLFRFTLTAALLAFLILVAGLSFLAPKVEDTEPDVPSSLRALGVLGVFFAWDVLGFVGLGTLVGSLISLVDRFTLIIVSQVLLYLLLAVILSQAKLNKAATPFRRFSPCWLGKGYFAALAVVFLVNFLTAVLSGDAPKSENPVLSLFADAPTWQIAVLGALVVFVGPFFEEIIFRGWLFGGLRKEWGDTPALVLSSALFALIHGDAPGLIPLFCLGMIFGWVYRRSGSLWASILVHGFWNATTFALLISVMP